MVLLARDIWVSAWTKIPASNGTESRVVYHCWEISYAMKGIPIVSSKWFTSRYQANFDENARLHAAKFLLTVALLRDEKYV